MKSKVCSKCGEEKLLSEFGKRKGNIDGLSGFCLECMRDYKRVWAKEHYKENYERNRDKILNWQKLDRIKNPNKYKELQKNYRIKNKEKISKNRKKIHKLCPWKKIWADINTRCYNKNVEQYKYYGLKGIKNNFNNYNEIKFLWFRDKAYLMKFPTIDRIDNKFHYCLENCRFIENIENAIKDKRKPIFQCDSQGNFIRVFESLNYAARILKIGVSNICLVLKGKRKSAGGFLFKYKELL